jgi:hypothetical protein
MRRQRETQGHGRLGAAPPGPAPQHAERAAFAGRDLQTAQRTRLVHVEPGERRPAVGGAQRLLVRPQPFARIATAHDDEARKVDAGCHERRRIGPVGGRDPDDGAALMRQARQRGQGEAQLADAFAREQDLRQPGLRPAAAGQHGVERRVAGGQCRGLGRAIVAPPDRGMRKEIGKCSGGHPITVYAFGGQWRANTAATCGSASIRCSVAWNAGRCCVTCARVPLHLDTTAA